MRDVIFYSNDDTIICKGTTAWLLLDAKTMRPKIMPQLFPDVTFLEDKSAVDDLPDKFESITHLEKTFSKQMKYSDIDLNKHANNAKYVELIMDCYDQEFHNLCQMKSLTISFLAEAKYGDTIEILKSVQTEEEKTHFIKAKNLDTDKTVFQAKAEWK